jgi:hypothetical protein
MSQEHNLIALIQNPERAEQLAVEHALECNEPFIIYVDLYGIDKTFRLWTEKYYKTNDNLGYQHQMPYLYHSKHLIYMLYSMVPFISKSAYTKPESPEKFYVNNGLRARVLVYDHLVMKAGIYEGAGLTEYTVEPFEEITVFHPGPNKREELLKKIRAIMW